jgi:hypothetical protein
MHRLHNRITLIPENINNFDWKCNLELPVCEEDLSSDNNVSTKITDYFSVNMLIQETTYILSSTYLLSLYVSEMN